MGTNYYLVTKKRPEIERKIFHMLSDGIHIGKSSYGWCFSLHVYPEHGINNLTDWEALIESSKGNIYNEYSDSIDKHDFIYDIIYNRKWAGTIRNPDDIQNQKFLDMNNAQEGPNNLLRSKIDNIHCIGHGYGTYDYIIGDFC